jgi:L-amino acid N-acyltransferase YncA
VPAGLAVRVARADDAEAIARIHNEGIAERVATFQTATQHGPEIAKEIERGRLVLVAELDGTVVGWASVAPYDDAHEYYSGVAEATLYVERGARRAGAGTALLGELAVEAERHGCYKLIGKVFTSNRPSIALVRSSGWREVGIHRRHGRLDGRWKDVLVVELLLGDAREEG